MLFERIVVGARVFVVYDGFEVVDEGFAILESMVVYEDFHLALALGLVGGQFDFDLVAIFRSFSCEGQLGLGVTQMLL